MSIPQRGVAQSELHALEGVLSFTLQRGVAPMELYALLLTPGFESGVTTEYALFMLLP